MSERTRVLFVCLGNICRSPSAEGVARAAAEKAGRAGEFEFDSAGTGDWHVGHPPDARATRAAANRGVDLSPLRARQFVAADFERFDLILAMDESNLANIERLRSAPETSVKLMMELAPDQPQLEVPDPYYGGADGFEYMLDLIEEAVEGLLQQY